MLNKNTQNALLRCYPSKNINIFDKPWGEEQFYVLFCFVFVCLFFFSDL